MKEETKEEWKDIPGQSVKQYQASNKGRIRSLGQKGISGKLFKYKKPKIRMVTIRKDGYVQIRRLGYVHRLVAQTFLPTPADASTQVHHINTDRSDNSVENLMWTSPMENVAHRDTTDFNFDNPFEVL